MLGIQGAGSPVSNDAFWKRRAASPVPPGKTSSEERLLVICLPQGTRRAILEKVSREQKPSTDGADITNKNGNEQHVFTLRPKY
jgi:hypothetical protein